MRPSSQPYNSRGNHGKESSKVNWDCTICRTCRWIRSDSSVLKWPEPVHQMAGVPVVSDPIRGTRRPKPFKATTGLPLPRGTVLYPVGSPMASRLMPCGLHRFGRPTWRRRHSRPGARGDRGVRLTHGTRRSPRHRHRGRGRRCPSVSSARFEGGRRAGSEHRKVSKQASIPPVATLRVSPEGAGGGLCPL